MDERFIIRSRRVVQLGPMQVDIRSNEERFAGMRYFSRTGDAPATARAHYTLSLCNLNVDGPWPLQRLMEERDRTYRGKRFAAGYYITDHFGAPAYLITRGTHYWIFAHDFEPVLWPYVVKLLLTVCAMEHGMVHLKAAGIAVAGRGTLLVGRGGSGKTVLLTKLCQAGAQFLSNTHALIEGETMLALPSAMRVRADALFGPLIAARKLPPSVKPGEYLADPLLDMGWQWSATAPLRNICLVDYRGAGRHDVHEIDRDVLFEYVDQFSLALNVYGLKEDVFDYLAGDVGAFATHVSGMKDRLRAMIGRCRGYYVSSDVMEPRNLAAILRLLAGE